MPDRANNSPDRRAACDQNDRTIYGNSVHRDIAPLSYVGAAALLALLAPWLPTVVLASLIIVYSAVLGYNLIALRPS